MRRNMVVRRFEPKDAEPLSQLIIQNLRQVNIKDYPPEAIDKLVQFYTPARVMEDARHQLIIVSLVDKQVVGTVSLDQGRVRSVFVDVGRHGNGIGKELMAVIETYAQKQGLKKIFLLSGLSAYGFYEKLGYEVVKRFENNLDGIPLSVIQMEKTLEVDNVCAKN
ncbi:MAG: GNAT family N-acetyltransferase [Anaerolineae bacterium]|nr:GNAT family N-acetyltransferase [Anaerolineae bacterium]